MHHAHIDKFAYQDSPVHRLDSRVKFIVVVVFTAVVISLPRYSVSVLACYAVGPFAMLVVGRIPIGFALKHILVVSPFVAVLAFSCVLYDRAAMTVRFGPFEWVMAAGWLRCAGILGKFAVTMSALIGLVSTTRFSDLLSGLSKLGVPKILLVQMGLLYRYIFLLIDKAQRILRARAGRKLRNLGVKAELKTAGSMIGSLLVSSLDCAERINWAMQGRGFDPDVSGFRTLTPMRIRRADFVFCAIAACLLVGLHFVVRIELTGGKTAG